MSRYFAPVVVLVSIVAMTLALITLLATGPDSARGFLALAALILAGTAMIMAALTELLVRRG